MDRNDRFQVAVHCDTLVALRKESVDRNIILRCLFLSSLVALRKESVDRNVSAFDVLAVSAVALRKESVDRNLVATPAVLVTTGRSPQGERG